MSLDESFLIRLLHAFSQVGLERSTAAVMQGVPMMTQDIDVLVRDTDSNRQKISKLCELLKA